MATPGSEGSVKQLNSLLRGEISAVETYRAALESASDDVSDTDEVAVLRDIQEDHGRAAQALRQCVRQLGGEPADDSGAWGTWASAVQSTANMLGSTAGLKSLKEGEEHGLKDYQEAVRSGNLDPMAARLIAEELIPAQTRHLSILDRMIAAA